MFIFRKAADLAHYLASKKSNRKKVAFVPTMGALHEGHIALVNTAAQAQNIVVVSIFINPTQFNNTEDFQKYPITIEQDIFLLEKNNCDILFFPSVEEMYPQGINQLKHYDLGFLEQVFEGAFRPGHFQGVANIVYRLLDIVQPDKLYLGQKDYQQCMVISKLLEIENLTAQIQIVPTRRADDGLALSSRNSRLNPVQRAVAPVIYQCMVSIQAQQGIKPLGVVKKECLDLLKHKGFEPEYIELVHAGTLEPFEEYPAAGIPSVIIAAAWLGSVRLIDNLVI